MIKDDFFPVIDVFSSIEGVSLFGSYTHKSVYSDTVNQRSHGPSLPVICNFNLL